MAELTRLSSYLADSKIKVPHVFHSSVSDLIADTTLSYSRADGNFPVVEGAVVRAEGFDYRVAPADADDSHLITAQGVKLYVQPAPDGSFNIRAFGAAPSAAELQTAVVAAEGREIVIPGDVTVIGTAAITGPHDVHISGNGKLDWSGTGILATDGNVTIRDVTISNATMPVVSGDNVTGVVDYDFQNVTFAGCARAVDWVVPGADDFANGVGLGRLMFNRCMFRGGLGIAIRLETRIQSMSITDNDFVSGAYAAVWIGAATRNRQSEMSNVTISGNRVDGLASVTGNETAVCAFQIQASRVSIRENIIENVTTTHGASNGVDVWGIYTKSHQAIIANNILSNVTSDASSGAVLINVKGDEAAGTLEPAGSGVQITGNTLRNTDDVYAIGINCFSDRFLVANNYMQGIALPVNGQGQVEFERNDFFNNVAVAPPPSYRDTGIDLRAANGTYHLHGNTVDGYVNCIRVRVDSTDIDLVEMVNNTLVADDAPFRFEETGGTAITKTVIRGGHCTGAYLCRWDDADATPDIEISDVDVAGIANTFLFIGAVKWRNGRVRDLSGQVLSFAGASSQYCAYFKLAENTVASVDYAVVAQSTDGTAYIGKQVRDTWSRIGSANPARLGSETVVYDSSNAGLMKVQSSGEILQLRASGAAAQTMDFRCTYDVVLSNSG